jgi:PIN domain nuclease of toxin-antitoxin system
MGNLMRLLLDTCTFLWLCNEPEKLSKTAVSALEKKSCERSLSLGSVWEIVLKYRTGKIPLPDVPQKWIEEQAEIQDIHFQDLSRSVLYRSGELAADHRDPFDRILAAESLVHGLTVLSPDAFFRRLGCEVIW